MITSLSNYAIQREDSFEKENSEGYLHKVTQYPYNDKTKRCSQGFYRQKVINLREILKNIKDEIAEETSIPTALESLCTTTKNTSKPAPTIYLREISRLK